MLQHEALGELSKPSERISKQKDHKFGSGRSKNKSKSVKSQIRSLERLLKNKGSQLTPAAKKAKQNQIAELKRLQQEHSRRDHERSTVKQYRMLKFFEKRKLTRKLENIVAKGDKAEDAGEKAQILRDLRYINGYPKDKKYISLFPTGGHTEESKARVEEMRDEIEKLVSVPKDPEPPKTSTSPGVDPEAGNDDFFLDEGGA